MKRSGLFFLVFFLSACQTMQVIHLPSSSREQPFACPYPFLRKKDQMIHAIEVRIGGKVQTVMIGITVADPVSRSVFCSLLTAEGMVLFEAESRQGKVKVSRKLPPFESEVFAKNLMDDVELIFFPPRGSLNCWGYFDDGSKVCRYLEGKGNWIDVIAKQELGETQIKFYLPSGVLKKRVVVKGEKPYQHVELFADEPMDYSLVMTLVETQAAVPQK